MAEYGYLFEVAGLPWALASSANAPVQWSQTIYRRMFKVPVGSTIECDLIEGTSRTGGGSYWAVNLSDTLSTDFFQMAKTSGYSRLVDTLSAGVLTFDVEDGGKLSGASYLYIGKETVSISSIVSNTVTAAARGRFGSEETTHEQASVIDGGLFPRVSIYPPFLKGRQCWLKRYDLVTGSVTSSVASGFLENFTWHPDGSVEFSLHSYQQILFDKQIVSTPYARGRLIVDGTDILSIDGLHVELADPDVPFPEPAPQATWAHIRLRGAEGEEELIGYYRRQYPIEAGTAIAGSTGQTVAIDDSSLLRVGDTIQIEGAGVQRQQIRKIASATSFECTADLDPLPLTGDSILVVSRMRLFPPLYRKGAGITELAALPLIDGMDLEEVRYIEGDQVDVFLQLLLSRDGLQVNSTYDVLSPGWGANLPQADVDVTAFEDLRKSGRTGPRRFLFSEGAGLWDFASWIMRACYCYLFTDRSGLLTVAPVRMNYPDDSTTALAIDKICSEKIRLDAQEAAIRNYWQWQMDRPILDQSGDPQVLQRMQNADSVSVYGAVALPDMDDPGLTIGSMGQAIAVAEIRWSREAWIHPRISFTLAYSIGEHMLPGDRVSITFPHVPDLAGGKGYTDQVFEIRSVKPRDTDNKIDFEAEGSLDQKVGLVCPSAIVESTLGTTIVFVASATTLLSQSGTEDVEHFIVGDTVIFVDVSSLSGTPATHTTTVTAVNYGSRALTFAAVPAWLFVGDIILPGLYSTWSGRTTSTAIAPTFLWQEGHVFWADSTTSPPALGSDDAFVYGS